MFEEFEIDLWVTLVGPNNHEILIRMRQEDESQKRDTEGRET